MKFILSRKGFDSSWGGHACPLLRDGTLLMLPIPVRDGEHTDGDTITYGRLCVPTRDETFLEVMRSHGMTHLAVDAQKVRLTEEIRCHLDPDLVREVMDRPTNWTAAFGQSAAAEGHLRKQGIGREDIFLFYGIFQESNGTEFVPKARWRHIIFGYLQIGEVFRTNEDACRRPAWTHPHFAQSYTKTRNNAIYSARSRLTINEKYPDLAHAGYGVFKYREELVLTKSGATSHTQWRLPEFFHKDGVEISYHPPSSSPAAPGRKSPRTTNRISRTPGKKVGWTKDKEYFQAAYRGQEFVFEATPSAIDWFISMLPAAGRG